MSLIAKKISKSFRKPKPLTLFKDIDFELHRGESIAITGESGVGKTTLLHVLGALETPNDGTIQIDDIFVSKASSAMLRNEKIGFIFQAFYLLEDLSAVENVLFPAKIGRKNKTLDHGLDLLKKVGIEHLAHHPVHLLSGGERQRVCIARALCNNPPFIFADEPTGNLDQQTGQSVADLLFSLVKNQNKALLLVTHEDTLAKRCSKILRLDHCSLYTK